MENFKLGQIVVGLTVTLIVGLGVGLTLDMTTGTIVGTLVVSGFAVGFSFELNTGGEYVPKSDDLQQHRQPDKNTPATITKEINNSLMDTITSPCHYTRHIS